MYTRGAAFDASHVCVSPKNDVFPRRLTLLYDYAYKSIIYLVFPQRCAHSKEKILFAIFFLP